MSAASMKAWINIGPGGTFGSSGALRTTVADLDDLESQLAAGEKTRLVLYFHGGLVGERQGHALAERLTGRYATSPAIPVTVVWETAPVEILKSNLEKLHDTKLFKKLLSWIIEQVAAYFGLGGGGVARGSGGALISHDEIELFLESEKGIATLDKQLEGAKVVTGARGGGSSTDETNLAEEERNLSERLKSKLTTDPQLLDLIDDAPSSVQQQLNGKKAGARGVTFATVAFFLGKVTFATVRRRIRGTDHGLLPTAVEELLRAAYLSQLGKMIWDGMKDAAHSTWRDDGERPSADIGHVGGYLLRRLEALQRSRPEFLIDLVGHSAGAIAICHMLNAIRGQARGIRLRNIIFLAPACRLDLFADAVARNSRLNARFRMFNLSDEHERQDKLVPILYPRSLLYFVSGALEAEAGAALAGLQRHLIKSTPTAESEFDDVRNWLKQEDRLVYAPSKPDAAIELACAALAHGAFNDDEITLKSLVAIASA
jgi:Alpha/beta hydrolase of unknown function (DUF900)